MAAAAAAASPGVEAEGRGDGAVEGAVDGAGHGGNGISGRRGHKAQQAASLNLNQLCLAMMCIPGVTYQWVLICSLLWYSGEPGGVTLVNLVVARNCKVEIFGIIAEEHEFRQHAFNFALQ